GRNRDRDRGGRIVVDREGGGVGLAGRIGNQILADRANRAAHDGDVAGIEVGRHLGEREGDGRGVVMVVEAGAGQVNGHRRVDGVDRGGVGVGGRVVVAGRVGELVGRNRDRDRGGR